MESLYGLSGTNAIHWCLSCVIKKDEINVPWLEREDAPHKEHLAESKAILKRFYKKEKESVCMPGSTIMWYILLSGMSLLEMFVLSTSISCWGSSKNIMNYWKKHTTHLKIVIVVHTKEPTCTCIKSIPHVSDDFIVNDRLVLIWYSEIVGHYCHKGNSTFSDIIEFVTCNL